MSPNISQNPIEGLNSCNAPGLKKFLPWRHAHQRNNLINYILWDRWALILRKKYFCISSCLGIERPNSRVKRVLGPKNDPRYIKKNGIHNQDLIIFFCLFKGLLIYRLKTCKCWSRHLERKSKLRPQQKRDPRPPEGISEAIYSCLHHFDSAFCKVH